ncbi:MAG TPA: transcriptional regulator [Streptosporangiaceae bacterium]|nr:transcriptional regulator [Streptosporangiaceae bacterium]
MAGAARHPHHRPRGTASRVRLPARTNLELSAGNLSQHLGVLENAGLITLEKGYAGKRARTWVTITKAGRAALAEEITQLKLLISRIDSACRRQGDRTTGAFPVTAWPGLGHLLVAAVMRCHPQLAVPSRCGGLPGRRVAQRFERANRVCH